MSAVKKRTSCPKTYSILFRGIVMSNTPSCADWDFLKRDLLEETHWLLCRSNALSTFKSARVCNFFCWFATDQALNNPIDLEPSLWASLPLFQEVIAAKDSLSLAHKRHPPKKSNPNPRLHRLWKTKKYPTRSLQSKCKCKLKFDIYQEESRYR